MKTDRVDIHQHITDKIVRAIEHGAGEFHLPRHRSTGMIDDGSSDDTPNIIEFRVIKQSNLAAVQRR
jgi:hypothetical protein